MSMAGWLKKGAESSKQFAEAKQQAEVVAAQKNKMFRFWIKEGEEARITFVDGVIAKSGVNKGCLEFASYYEHNLQLQGRWNNFFVCLHSDGHSDCPICEDGDKPSFVGALTVIDHREYKAKDGKVYKNQKRLFIAKSQTLQVLQQLAVKRGGLVGCTFDVYRATGRDAAVGSTFDFIQKDSVEDLQKEFTMLVDGKPVTYFTPAEYDKELPFYSDADLRKQGFGTAKIGKEPPAFKESEPTTDEDFSEEL